MGRNGGGFSIRDRWTQRGAKTGMRWQAAAWDPRARRRRYGTFPDTMPDGGNGYEAALAWAREKAAQQRLGLETVTSASLGRIAASYCDDLVDNGRHARHVAEIRRVVASLVAAGIDEMNDKDFPRRVRSHIVAMRDSHKFRQKGVTFKGRGKDRVGIPHEPRPLGAVTRHRYLGHIKSIARFAVTWDHLLKNPMDKVELDPGRTSQSSFKVDELRKLVAPGDDRLWLTFCLQAYAGLRIGEALHVRWECIDWAANRLYVKKHPAYHLKGGKERSVPLQPELRNILEPRRRDLGWIVDDAKLRYMGGAAKPKPAPQPDSKQLWEIFREYVTDRGVPILDRSSHSLRHTWVPLMMASGEDSAYIQIWAGHSKVETTLGYSDAKEALRDAVKGWGRGELRLQPATSPLALKAS